MANIIFILSFLSLASAFAELNPKLICHSPKDGIGRQFRVEITYSPWNKTSSANLFYESKYGSEPITKIILKKPGYNSANIYFSEDVFSELGNMGEPSFKMIIDKRSLRGSLEYHRQLFNGSPKIFFLKVSCLNAMLPFEPE
jgi:hypothetical protein